MTQQELKDLITGLMENHIGDRCCSDQERADSRTMLAEALAAIEQIAANERERCAQLAEAGIAESEPGPYNNACRNIAATIRRAKDARTAFILCRSDDDQTGAFTVIGFHFETSVLQRAADKLELESLAYRQTLWDSDEGMQMFARPTMPSHEARTYSVEEVKPWPNGYSEEA